MKKLILIGLILALCLAFVACSETASSGKADEPQTKEMLFQAYFFDSADDIVKTATRTEAISYTINENGSVLMVLPIDKYNEQIEKTKNGIITSLASYIFGSETQDAIANLDRAEYADDFSDIVFYTSKKAFTDTAVRAATSTLVRNLFVQQGVAEEEIDFTIRFINNTNQEEYIRFSYKENQAKQVEQTSDLTAE